MTNKKNQQQQKTDPDTPLYFVGIGASAGGLEAIDSLISNMPGDTDMTFVIVQHLSPDYKSLMVELLSKCTDMQVLRAVNNALVEKNKIYLIPPKKNLTIFHGKLILTDQDRSGVINLPIDLFLQSLADDQQNHAIGIILSGTGSDGMRGVRAIKEQGGMVMVQTEDSAKFDGMPRSAISTGLCDFILSPEEMPQQLVGFIKHPYAAQQEISATLLTDEDELTRMFFLLRDKCKVDFTFYKPSTVIRRLERRMTVNQIYELKDYVTYLQNNPAEIKNLYRELLIGVTRFFRDDSAFEEIMQHSLPELFNNKEENELRLWVTACSTGEEAYSLAMYCRETMERLGINKNIKIFATDVDERAIQFASQGLYAESIIADVPADFVSKYFFHQEERFQISRNIREMVVFAKHDVLKDPPFTNIDFVSCRNLLIYFQPVLQKRAIEMFNFALNPNGILFLGSSETTGDLSHLFETINSREKIYRSYGKRHASLNNEQINKFSHRRSFRPVAEEKTRLKSGHYQAADDRMLERFLKLLGQQYIPLTMLVNEEFEIIHVVGNAEGLLSVPTGKMENNLLKMAKRELSIPLATGIPKVFKTNTELLYSNINLHVNNENNVIHLKIYPLEISRNQEPLVAVFFDLEKKQQQKPTITETNFDVSKEAELRIQDLEQELQFSRENLQATVEELETSNEELQATNEELLASNEELQSTNEELQSVNEELYTVNAENQSKIIELTELNNDLDNLLISTDIATLFLDEDLELRKYTPQISQFFKILENDLGRPISHIYSELVDIDIVSLIEKVIKTDTILEKEVQTENGQWSLMRVMPYHIGPNVSSGVVITFISIHKTITLQNKLSEAVERFDLAQSATHFGVWDWNIEKGQLFLTQSAEQLFGLQQGEFSNHMDSFMAIIHPEDLKLVNQLMQDAIHNLDNYHFEHRIIWPNGTIRWIREYGQLHRNEDGNAIRMIGIVTDITKEKQTENSLDGMQQMFQLTMENLQLSVVQLDSYGNIIFINTYLLQLTGWEKQDVINKNWFELFVSPDQSDSQKENYAAYSNGQNQLKTHEKIKLLCKNGDKLQISWDKTPLVNKEGKPIGMNAIGIE